MLNWNVHIEVRDAKTGELIEERKGHNIITDIGLELLRDLMGGTCNREPTHIDVGTNNTTETAADTQLAAEVFINNITKRIQLPFGINFQLFISQGQANGNTLREAGLINRRNQQDRLFGRFTFADIVKTAAVTVTISWTVTIARA